MFDILNRLFPTGNTTPKERLNVPGSYKFVAVESQTDSGGNPKPLSG
jgi:hypothetical protein